MTPAGSILQQAVRPLHVHTDALSRSKGIKHTRKGAQHTHGEGAAARDQAGIEGALHSADGTGPPSMEHSSKNRRQRTAASARSGNEKNELTPIFPDEEPGAVRVTIISAVGIVARSLPQSVTLNESMNLSPSATVLPSLGDHVYTSRYRRFSTK